MAIRVKSLKMQYFFPNLSFEIRGAAYIQVFTMLNNVLNYFYLPACMDAV